MATYWELLVVFLPDTIRQGLSCLSLLVRYGLPKCWADLQVGFTQAGMWREFEFVRCNCLSASLKLDFQSKERIVLMHIQSCFFLVSYTSCIWHLFSLCEHLPKCLGDFVILLELSTDCLLFVLAFLLIHIHFRNTDLLIRKQLTSFHLKEHTIIPCSKVCQFNFLWVSFEIKIGLKRTANSG